MESQVRKDADALRVELIAYLRSAYANEEYATRAAMYDRTQNAAQALNLIDGGHCAVLERSFGSYAAAEIEMPKPAIDEAKLRAVVSEAFGAAAMGSLSVGDAKELIASSVLISAKSGELWAK